MKEEWRQIPGIDEVYEVSNKGRVRSRVGMGRSRPILTKPHIMGGAVALNGYRYVTVRPSVDGYPGRRRAVTVHSLVLLAFAGPRPPDADGSHLNGKRLDNRAENLVWESRKDNCERQREHGTCGARAAVTATDAAAVRARHAMGETLVEIARSMGVSTQIVTRIAQGKTWRVAA